MSDRNAESIVPVVARQILGLGSPIGTVIAEAASLVKRLAGAEPGR